MGSLSPRTERGPLRVYIAGVALWSAATGMQAVLFSWLVVGELGAPAQTVGLVQMAHVLPVLLLLLPGGAVADRLERRQLLGGAQLAAAAAALALAFAVANGHLSLPLLLAYAVAMGSLTAFVLPARDALLSDVAGTNLTRAATALTLAQFGAQAVGTLAASTARVVGLPAALVFQALLTLAAAGAALRLPRSRGGAHGTAPRAAELRAGLVEVARSQTLRSTMLAMSGVGLFLAGAWFVVLPILVRDHYRGDVAQLSVIMTVLQLGTVIGALALLRGRRLARRGRALLLSLGGAALPLLALSLAIPFGAALGASFAWGICVAGFQSSGRAIVQEAAPAAQRARVLSVFSLSVMGAGVLGQPVAGWLAGWLGPHGALGVAGAAMLAFATLAALLTPLWRVK